jgi:hypothetical protein
MTNEGKKLEPPLKLNMSFGEALSRFVATKPGEVDESVERSKTKKPPGDEAPQRPKSGSVKRRRP